MLNVNLKRTRRPFARARVESCFVPNIVFVIFGTSGAVSVLFFRIKNSVKH